MRIHLIAIGGAVMHNLALALHHNKHKVTGSDDEIYNPARDRLGQYDLLPSENGWFPEKINSDIDLIILGMHARKDNPELLRAQELGLKIQSFPAFIYEHSKNKKRLVVAGSHGKTTTTSMVMHVLKYCNKRFDYLVGAQLEGFDTMVKLSDAPIIVIEGDEYLSSSIDRRPKFIHYRPHIAILTGIAWDHVNVFPTFENYLEQFKLLVENLEENGNLIFYQKDPNILKLLKSVEGNFLANPYTEFPSNTIGKETTVKSEWGTNIPVQFFGQHNMANLKAAYLMCREVGINHEDFFEAIKTFKGASKRLQILQKAWTSITWLDFAHAPSKAKATVNAVKNQYPHRKLVACLELHTYSSLSKNFLPQYAQSLEKADEAIVYFSHHTLKMKKLPDLNQADITNAFQHPNLKVFTDNQDLVNHLMSINWHKVNLLFMTSGNFSGLNLEDLAEELQRSKASSV